MSAVKMSSKAALRPSLACNAIMYRRQLHGTPTIPAEHAPPGAKTAGPDKVAILNKTTEAINGRAAMLGFVSAIGVEAITHNTVFNQLAGRYEDQHLMNVSTAGVSELMFGLILALVTLGTLAPRLLENMQVDSRSFGVFTPALEKALGRTAMLGFVGIIIAEAIKGASLV